MYSAAVDEAYDRRLRKSYSELLVHLSNHVCGLDFKNVSYEPRLDKLPYNKLRIKSATNSSISKKKSAKQLPDSTVSSADLLKDRKYSGPTFEDWVKTKDPILRRRKREERIRLRNERRAERLEEEEKERRKAVALDQYEEWLKTHPAPVKPPVKPSHIDVRKLAKEQDEQPHLTAFVKPRPPTAKRKQAQAKQGSELSPRGDVGDKVVTSKDDGAYLKWLSGKRKEKRRVESIEKSDAEWNKVIQSSSGLTRASLQRVSSAPPAYPKTPPVVDALVERRQRKAARNLAANRPEPQGSEVPPEDPKTDTKRTSIPSHLHMIFSTVTLRRFIHHAMHSNDVIVSNVARYRTLNKYRAQLKGDAFAGAFPNTNQLIMSRVVLSRFLKTHVGQARRISIGEMAPTPRISLVLQQKESAFVKLVLTKTLVSRFVQREANRRSMTPVGVGAATAGAPLIEDFSSMTLGDLADEMGQTKDEERLALLESAFNEKAAEMSAAIRPTASSSTVSAARTIGAHHRVTFADQLTPDRPPIIRKESNISVHEPEVSSSSSSSSSSDDERARVRSGRVASAKKRQRRRRTSESEGSDDEF